MESNGEKLLYVSDSRVFDSKGNPGVYSGHILPTAGGLPHGDNGTFCYIGAVTQTPIDTFVGSWNRGEWHGHGKCLMRNGDVYEGMHEFGQRQGTGRYTWKLSKKTQSGASAAAAATAALSSEPRVYEGDFVQNQRHGQGHYHWGNLSYYKGNFVHGQRQGHGVYVHHAQKLEYVGEWVKGKYHGQGVLTYPCRRCVGRNLTTDKTESLLATYKGSWVAGQRHGYGIETMGDGKVRHDGMWNHDTPMIVSHTGSSRASRTMGGSISDGIGDINDASSASAASAVDSRRSSTGSLGRTLTSNSTSTATAATQAGPHAGTATGQTLTSNSSSRSAASTSQSQSHSQTNQREAPDTSGEANTIVVNQERCRDARGFYGLYKGILFRDLPQGVGTMNYTATDDSNNNNSSSNYHDDVAMNEPSTANNPVAEYEGFWEDGKYHGFGRMQMKNGDKYVGNFDSNQRHGPDGEYWYADGRHYKGDWYNGVRHGSGRFLYPETGDLYQGDFVHGQRQGQGKFTFGRDGTSYDGQWFQGQYHGQGALISETGAVYTGTFEYGKFHGEGRHVDSNGEVIFDGEFINGMPLPEYEKKQKAEQQKGIFSKMADAVLSPGSATPRRKLDAAKLMGNSTMKGGLAALTLSASAQRSKLGRDDLNPSRNSITSSSLLSGLMVPNIFGGGSSNTNSNGTAKTNSNSKTSADETKQDDDDNCKAVVDQLVWDGQNNSGRYTGILHIPTQRPHGVGRMVYKDGNRIYEGFWAKGHRQGHGRCMFVHMGDFHEGQYHINLRHGPGKYIWKDGRRFVGEYRHDERHGPGKFWYPNGDKYEGMFEHGQRSGQGVFTFGPSCSYRGSWANGVYHGPGTLQWTQTTKTSVSAPMMRSKQKDVTTVRTTKHKYAGGFHAGAFHGRGAEYEIVTAGGGEEERLVRKGVWEKGEYMGEVSDDEHDHEHAGGGDSGAGEDEQGGSGVKVSTANTDSTQTEAAVEQTNEQPLLTLPVAPILVEEPRSPTKMEDGEWEKVAAEQNGTATDNTPAAAESSSESEKPAVEKADNDNKEGDDSAEPTQSKDDSHIPLVDASQKPSTVKRALSAPPVPHQNTKTLAKECSSGEEQTYEADRDAWRSTLDME